MATVIGVRFRNAGKLFYFNPNSLWPRPGSMVIVETARGVEFGEVVTGVQEVQDEDITPPLRNCIRIATAEDEKHHKKNVELEKEAVTICQKKIVSHKLEMKLVGAEYTFDNNKLLFYFTSDKRVDFRAMVKDLALVFRTRIELRQIGVRDEAKMMGGLGMCGRPVCCSKFLGDFQPVSIKMAKEQSLTLNPSKISGICGRLMCCLKFEEDYYEKTRKKMPRLGKNVTTPDGIGMVQDLNILRETVKVRIESGDSVEIKDFHMSLVKQTTPAPHPHRTQLRTEFENRSQQRPRVPAAGAVDKQPEKTPPPSTKQNANTPSIDDDSFEIEDLEQEAVTLNEMEALDTLPTGE